MAAIRVLSLLLLSCQVYGDSLLGKEVAVTSALHAPYLSLKSDHANRMGNDKYEGYTMDLLTQLAAKLGCKFFVKLVADGKYGRYDVATSSWSGMMGEVVSGEAEMVVADLTMTSERERAVDFSFPFMHVGITLLVKKPSRWEVPINSVDDLVKQNKVKFGTAKGGATEQFFKNSKVPTYQKIWETMQANEGFATSNNEGVEKVLDGDYAFFMESGSAEYHTARNCQLTTVGELLNLKGYGVVLRQGSVNMEEVNIAVLELREEGVLDVIKKKWWAQRGSTCLNEEWTQSLWNLLPSF
eukprot:GFUD01026172.1.p1 GENE.GFUD01026172.1~~GFUD01026172.1.p1  ORF type:complete len:298 (+),score=79.21 GFUD01026172.1:1-894(+)